MPKTPIITCQSPLNALKMHRFISKTMAKERCKHNKCKHIKFISKESYNLDFPNLQTSYLGKCKKKEPHHNSY
jgi:hypothetical protein